MARILPPACILLLLALALPASGGVDQYNVTFDILDESRVTERIEFTLEPPAEAPRDLFFDLGTQEGLAVTVDGTPATPHRSPDSTQVNVTLPTGARQVALSFTTPELVFSRSGELLFTSILSSPTEARRFQATVRLPPGYILLRDEISPSGAQRSTDGQRVAFQWTNLSPGSPVAFQLYYGNPSRTSLLVTFLAVGAIGAFALIMAMVALHYRRRVSQARMEGFSEDEQKTITLLQSKTTMYQDQVIEELHFSKAKATRIVQKLESKGLIEKERIGRSNKLTWKK